MGLESTALTGAISWLLQLLTGSLAITLAILAVAFLGIQMLGGRVSRAKSVRVIVGAFILFGAPAISQGVLASARDGALEREAQQSSPPPPQLPATAPEFDPYAGAATPTG